MKNRKILLMGHTDGHGGSQTAFRKLYDFAVSEGHHVKVVCISDLKGSRLYFKKNDFCGAIPFTGKRTLLFLKKSAQLFRVGFKVFKFSPHIFVGVGLNNSTNFIARFTGSKCFKIGHDYIAERLPKDAIWAKSKTTMNGIALQSPSMLHHWRKIDPAIKAVNWLPCFPEPPVAGLQQIKSNASNRIIKIAYFGRLAKNKGLPLLIKALTFLDDYSNIQLDIWGNGTEEIALKNLVAEYNVQKNVRLYGNYPSADEGAKLMVSYDALVLCSTNTEGLPLILLESMAYGIPFLVTNVGAIRDCCEHNPDAILVEPNQEAVTKGLSLLIHHIQTMDFNSDRLRLFYEKNFSYNIMASRWRTCFHDPKRFFSDQS